MAEADFFSALEKGDLSRVAQYLPAMANSKGGSHNWEPILYPCFLALPNALEIAKLLIRNGANPNAFYLSNDGCTLSCLYGAAGLNNNLALARVLIEAGAIVNDGESLYHSTEHVDHACMKLLLEHGADASQTNVLKHMLDREDAGGVRLLLDAGADPEDNGDHGATALHWAVWRGRSAEVVRLLLDKGANINAQRKDGRTAYDLAVLGKYSDVAALLDSRGANTELKPVSVKDEHLIPDLAEAHRTEAVRDLLALGLPVNGLGQGGATALHWACWKGYADLVELLLQNGASLTVTDSRYHATPAGWMEHGRENCREGDYSAVERLLAKKQAELHRSEQG
jgi:ankyrin repeat protein